MQNHPELMHEQLTEATLVCQREGACIQYEKTGIFCFYEDASKLKKDENKHKILYYCRPHIPFNMCVGIG
jgi:hypothetical protein